MRSVAKYFVSSGAGILRTAHLFMGAGGTAPCWYADTNRNLGGGSSHLSYLDQNFLNLDDFVPEFAKWGINTMID
jgi:hypothetical protein